MAVVIWHAQIMRQGCAGKGLSDAVRTPGCCSRGAVRRGGTCARLMPTLFARRPSTICTCAGSFFLAGVAPTAGFFATSAEKRSPITSSSFSEMPTPTPPVAGVVGRDQTEFCTFSSSSLFQCSFIIGFVARGARRACAARAASDGPPRGGPRCGPLAPPPLREAQKSSILLATMPSVSILCLMEPNGTPILFILRYFLNSGSVCTGGPAGGAGTSNSGSGALEAAGAARFGGPSAFASSNKVMTSALSLFIRIFCTIAPSGRPTRFMLVKQRADASKAAGTKSRVREGMHAHACVRRRAGIAAEDMLTGNTASGQDAPSLQPYALAMPACPPPAARPARRDPWREGL